MQAMNTKTSKPHFFKTILPGFENGLKIPTDFSNWVLGNAERCAGEALLKKNGKEWRVNVVKAQFVGSGWRRFAVENKLEAGDFVVFRNLGKMVFGVVVLDGVTQCKRERGEPRIEASRVVETKTMKKQNSARPDKGKSISESEYEFESETESESESEHDGRPMKKVDYRHRQVKGRICISKVGPYFTSTVTASNTNIRRRCFNIPLEFARSYGLLEKRKIVLEDGRGRRYRVSLNSDYCHLRIVGGWKAFLDATRIKQGDAYRFEIVKFGDVPVVRFTILCSCSRAT